MQEIFGKPSEANDRDAGTVVVRAAESGDWREEGVPGFRTRVLFHDPGTGESTALMQMDRGAAALAHAHEHVERIYVLEGSFSDDDGTYHAGDYVQRPAGANHTTWSDDGGLVLLVYTRPHSAEAVRAAG
jgi:anti-sigma factor ChrR (cupin superfamily)